MGGAELVDLNEWCRFECHTPGQKLGPHHDARYQRPQNHPHAGDGSTVTVQLYLHDAANEHGGATTFLHSDGPPALTCQHGRGSVLICSQDLYHEGLLLEGGLKHTLRTEAMYRQQAPCGPWLRRARLAACR